MLTAKEGNTLIKESLLKNNPFFAGRFGSIELSCMVSYLSLRNWDSLIKIQMSTNTGFFPATDDMLEKYCKLILKFIPTMDIIGVWLNEDIVLQKITPSPVQVHLRSLEPYYHEDPWSQCLRGKKVLVIHPFQNSIQNQFKIRENLFKNSKILPDFSLITIKAVQSIAGTKTPFKNWFEAFDYMCEEINSKDFDIAIIGAGSYGLPLAGYIKNIGKKSIHMGGATQILFGIKGRRWDNHEDISKLYNSSWVRPGKEETPKNSTCIEGGCYW